MSVEGEVASPRQEEEEVQPPIADGGQEAYPSAAAAVLNSHSRPQNQQDSSVLKLKGLPYNTSQEQILEFFSGFAIKSIAFVGEPDGRPSGLAFAEFQSKEEAIKALDKNGEYIGERYVRLLHVPKSEMEEQVRLGTLAIPGTAAKMRSRTVRVGHQGHPPRGMPTNPMLHGGPQGAYGAPGGMMPGSGMVTGGHRAMPGMPAPPQYSDGHHNAWAAGYANPAALSAQFAGMNIRGKQGQGQGAAGGRCMGGGRGAGALMMMHDTLAAHTHPAMHHPHAQAGMSTGMGMATSQAQVMSNAQAAVLNPTSSTVKVRGLPYRSSPAEILAFFSGFQYLPDSLQIGLDSFSRPSGEAWLTFINSNEALKSVRDLNRHYLGNRYLELSIC